jgi:hypothetical protein
MDTAESRLAETIFIVEATSFEQHCLWAETSSTSDCRRFAPRKWEQMHGWLVTVGRLDKRPICVSMTWNRIDGQLVMFWHPTSQVVDMVQIEKWFDKHFNGKWDKGTRNARTDAMNFHHCLHAIDELNGAY